MHLQLCSVCITLQVASLFTQPLYGELRCENTWPTEACMSCFPFLNMPYESILDCLNILFRFPKIIIWEYGSWQFLQAQLTRNNSVSFSWPQVGGA